MDQRVAKLEALAERTDGRLHAIDKDLAVLRAEVKTSIAEAKNSIILWVVAAVFLWVSIGQKLAAKLNIVDASIGG